MWQVPSHRGRHNWQAFSRTAATCSRNTWCLDLFHCQSSYIASPIIWCSFILDISSVNLFFDMCVWVHTIKCEKEKWLRLFIKKNLHCCQKINRVLFNSQRRCGLGMLWICELLQTHENCLDSTLLTWGKKRQVNNLG
jgi:hypothetical protein